MPLSPASAGWAGDRTQMNSEGSPPTEGDGGVIDWSEEGFTLMWDSDGSATCHGFGLAAFLPLKMRMCRFRPEVPDSGS